MFEFLEGTSCCGPPSLMSKMCGVFENWFIYSLTQATESDKEQPII